MRATHGPIGAVLDALRDLAAVVGMEVATDVGQIPKVLLRSRFESGGGRLQVKVEINTHETSPARPHVRLPYEVESPWWSGRAQVRTFDPAELIATKLRALYQRRKGRDLFDLWLALTEMALDPDDILACLGPYRPDGYTVATAVANLEGHVVDRGFRDDLLDLVAEETGFDVEVTRLVGIYSDPGFVVAYDDGEVRQQFSVCFACRIVGGEPRTSDESLQVGFFSPAELDDLPMGEAIRLRVRHYLEDRDQPVIA